MVRNQKRHIISGRLKTTFTKRAHMELERMIEGSQFCTISIARHNKYEVELHEDKYSVDMNEHKCGCIKWQMTGIPCVHAAAVIISKKQKVEDFVSDWYTTRMWQLTYADGIEPVQGQMEWPRMNRLGVMPPPWRKGNPGRPNNHARKKGRYESKTATTSTRISRKDRIITCGNCKQDGHNRLSCTNPAVAEQPKRPRGRPRKDQEPRNVLFGQGQTWEGSQASHGSQPSQGSQRGSQASQGSQRQAPPQRQPPRRQPQQRRQRPQRNVAAETEGHQWEASHAPPTSQGRGGWRSWFECSS
ncbi:unnamed protein product [Arabidopsis halleri]